MRFSRLMITNFKGITHVDLQDLGDTVVIAGPNGCGKSCIFDAVKLWKSAYGGYSQNEIGNWSNEQGIGVGRDTIVRTLQNKNEAMVIYADFQISDRERDWLRTNWSDVLRAAAFRKRVPEHAWNWQNFRQTLLDENLRVHDAAVNQEIERDRAEFLSELEMESVPGSVTCFPDGRIEAIPSIFLSRLLSTYMPENLGIFDYHGPQRTYNRENISSINLQLDHQNNQRAQHSLYNTSNKYNTVKTELASAYIRKLIAAEANSATLSMKESAPDLIETIKEMFERFFPGKQFLGVQPTANGDLTFNVRTAIGDHDIHELSSGEKELIYGYLRLKNESHRDSILMLDEPELHLNPRLTLGLPDFYHRHIGQALNNQLWLITHSDSILRQSVGWEGFSVYHMQPAGQYEGDEQAIQITATAALERAIIDLVGDLAAYKPNGKIVFLEGGGDSEFDKELIGDLFEDFFIKVNLVSAGNKHSVRSVHAILQQASTTEAISARIYSISDRDDDIESGELPGRVFVWDRYHIENYLLEADFILQAMIELKAGPYKTATVNEIEQMLIVSARKTLLGLVKHEIEGAAQKLIYRAIKVRTSKNDDLNGDILGKLTEATKISISNIIDSQLNPTVIQKKIDAAISRREISLENGTWKKEFRGRDILRDFIGSISSVRYEHFRNIILARMKAAGFRPSGMASVIEAIENS